MTAHDRTRLLGLSQKDRHEERNQRIWKRILRRRGKGEGSRRTASAPIRVRCLHETGRDGQNGDCMLVYCRYDHGTQESKLLRSFRQPQTSDHQARDETKVNKDADTHSRLRVWQAPSTTKGWDSTKGVSDQCQCQHLPDMRKSHSDHKLSVR